MIRQKCKDQMLSQTWTCDIHKLDHKNIVPLFYPQWLIRSLFPFRASADDLTAMSAEPVGEMKIINIWLVIPTRQPATVMSDHHLFVDFFFWYDVSLVPFYHLDIAFKSSIIFYLKRTFKKVYVMLLLPPSGGL